MTENLKPPAPAPFRNAAECLEAWFAALGPAGGSRGASGHPSLLFPISGRLPGLRLLAARTRATRAAGAAVPVLDACDALGLDLLDRLVLLALLREALDVRGGGGQCLVALCDAAGAADWTQQAALRDRLETGGVLRRLQLVQSDLDPVANERSYRLDPRWKEALLAGRTTPAAEPVPVPATAEARLQTALQRAGRLLYLVAPPHSERVQAWSDARPDAPGWDPLSFGRRRLFATLEWYLDPDGPGAADPLGRALRDAGTTSCPEAGLVVTLLSRDAEDEPVAASLLAAALGIEATAQSPLLAAGALELAERASGLPPAFTASQALRHRVLPPGLACGSRREASATAASSRAEAAERIVPRLTLSGLVLRAETRARLVEALAVPQGLAAAAEWGASESLLGTPGVALLLYGPPGTGKTLAAEAIAGELGRGLWRLRADQLLDKYVGETEKRIASAFRAAREAGDVVLLDEADSLLGVRGEETRRWEVSSTNLLLQEIERFGGVVVLTTNRDAALDPALERRLLARLEIGMPGPAERAELWERHLPPRAPRAADVDLASLARTYALSGSHIRTAALFAVAKAASRPDGQRLLTRADLQEAASAQLARGSEKRPVVGFRPAAAPAPRLALVAAQCGDGKE
jgi:hypothetical protein